uniref:SGNH hydrolase-type esterase domain-containing protein n=1 Tax=Stegastes partitus TaxID=144197 RepID=A0A3B5ASY0_9TELE
MVLCVDCNPTLTQLKADISHLQDALKERDKLILELLSVATARSKHLSLLSHADNTSLSCPPDTTATAPDNYTTIPWTGEETHSPEGRRSCQGVKPKSPACSTPSVPESWVQAKSRRRITSSTEPAPQLPSVLIVGDSIIRDVRSSKAVTHCFPGAKVNDILTELPSLMAKFPSARKVVLHVGTNDIPRQQLELLKEDFKRLFNYLQRTEREVFISGPLPTVGRGCGRFSRLLQIHMWLQSQCRSFGLGFIGNFNLLWERSSFFKCDGLHPNRGGSRTLLQNVKILTSSLMKTLT